uniref:Helicase C-terminal domain-containing protein n=1 Tax=Panagrellus redivivus TaxID=6233 RepID=A0A7E4W0J0_PANRE
MDGNKMTISPSLTGFQGKSLSSPDWILALSRSIHVPQYLLKHGYTNIACTEPRKIACTALANRVTLESMNVFDKNIAYQTRFESTKTRATKLLFLTDTLLLRQMALDHDLKQYNVVILDEVHERHLSGDLLCSLLRDLVARRPDFRLIVMSATINLQLYQNFFKVAPVIEVPGRLHPIRLDYRPIVADPGAQSSVIDSAPYIKILEEISSVHPSAERGDVLIFLNGVAEISKLADALKEYNKLSGQWIILILHSQLSVREQNLVFDIAPKGIRKVILSTNIAEASVTIDGIRFVIDSGKANVNYYNAKLRVTRLVSEYISKASANQRKGRAGRTGPGVCYRLYSSDQYESMRDFTPAEIQRTNLETLVLQIGSMKLGIGALDFDYLERPCEGALTDAIRSLKAQRILFHDNECNLTPLGEIAAKLPLDVHVSKLLIFSTTVDLVEIALTLAAGFSMQSIFTNRSWNDDEKKKNREQLMSEEGDLVTLLGVYIRWLKLRRDGKDTVSWCQDLGVEESRLYEIVKARHQLKRILIDAKLIEDDRRDLESMSKAERRDEITNRKRVFAHRRDAQNSVAKRNRVLEVDRHYDDLADEPDEPSAEDMIQSLEFDLIKNRKELKKEIAGHRLTRDTYHLLELIIAFGLYPQCAFDVQNNEMNAAKKDVYVRTHARIFAAFHPNSSLSIYYHNEAEIREKKQTKGLLASTHVYVFGTFLETKNQYLCNVSRVMGLFFIVSARHVVRKENSIMCDGFIEFFFYNKQDAILIIRFVVKCRKYLFEAVNNKLQGLPVDIGDFARSVGAISRMTLPFKLVMHSNPYDPSLLPGVFDADGTPLFFDHDPSADLSHVNEEQMEEGNPDAALDVLVVNEEEEDEKVDDPEKTEDAPVRVRHCSECSEDIPITSNIEFLQHKRSHWRQ